MQLITTTTVNLKIHISNDNKKKYVLIPVFYTHIILFIGLTNIVCLCSWFKQSTQSGLMGSSSKVSSVEIAHKIVYLIHVKL